MQTQQTAFLIFQSQGHYKVLLNHQELTATISGRYRHLAESTNDLPVVGDQVTGVIYDTDYFQIQGHLPRHTLIQRHNSNKQQRIQTLAANIATIFIVTSANQEFSEARLQRYLTMAWDSGATPVIVLSKTDLVSDSELTTFLDAVASVTFDSVPVITTGQTASNVAATFKPYLTAGQWVTFVGSSGVGKSTLINQLIKEPSVLTSGIRDDDDKGRHTTTNRQACQTASGAFIVDTPGMRELGMTSSMSKALKTVFTDIETLAQDCRFKDCQHQSEPGCAVRAAIDAGSLMPERLADFNKLAIEADYSQLSAREIEQAKVKRLMGSLKTRPTKQN